MSRTLNLVQKRGRVPVHEKSEISCRGGMKSLAIIKPCLVGWMLKDQPSKNSETRAKEVQSISSKKKKKIKKKIKKANQKKEKKIPRKKKAKKILFSIILDKMCLWIFVLFLTLSNNQRGVAVDTSFYPSLKTKPLPLPLIYLYKES